MSDSERSLTTVLPEELVRDAFATVPAMVISMEAEGRSGE